jgi:DNA (cytosine-5)-methyltransferase 1
MLPEASVAVGDIRGIKNEIVKRMATLIGEEDFALSFTPPCQGMSQNGMKTIMKYVRSGLRPEIDARNYLVMPCLDIIRETKPAVVFFENVTEAKDTMLLVNDEPIKFIKFLVNEMEGMGYASEVKEVNFKDYGVPQSRKRVFGVFSLASLEIGDTLTEKVQNTVTLRDAIGTLPALDAREKKLASKPQFHPLHKVPVMRPVLYEWVSNTPEGRSAFENNNCPSCLYENTVTSLYCAECEALLFKPHVLRNGTRQLIKGYDSSYRRQWWDKPSNTVTTRSAFASSASNLHPNQNRVLSIYECAILQGLKPDDIDWTEESTGRLYPDFLLRDVLGEAIPATFTELIGRRVLGQLNEKSRMSNLVEAMVV